MYRQLAGGLTTAHVMHGSANAIGGQNVTPENALGRLVARPPPGGRPPNHKVLPWARTPNGWEPTGTPIPAWAWSRSLPTASGWPRIIGRPARPGSVIRPASRPAATSGWTPWSIFLEGNLDVHSHSYRQDEILMLMRLADDMGFRVASFHHSLEAFKVAPELAERGASVR